MPLRAVFFDLDDTLCDTIGSRPQRARRAFERLSLEYPHLDVDNLVVRALEGMGAPRSVRGVPRVLEELGLLETAAGGEAIGAWFFVGCPDLLKTLPGVDGTVRKLSRDYILGVITNGDEELQRSKFSHLGLDSYIRHVVISESVGYEKPDPRIFQHALSLAGVNPHDAALVGDRLDWDVGGAKAAGMRAVWLNHWGERLDHGSPQPDAIIERFSDLPGALQQLSAESAS